MKIRDIPIKLIDILSKHDELDFVCRGKFSCGGKSAERFLKNFEANFKPSQQKKTKLSRKRCGATVRNMPHKKCLLPKIGFGTEESKP